MRSKTGIAVGITTALLPFQSLALRHERKLVKPESEEYEGDLKKLVEKFRDKGVVPPPPEEEVPVVEVPEDEDIAWKDLPTDERRPHPRWGRLGPPPTYLRNATTYWGMITCQEPHQIDIGIRMKVNAFPGDITFSVYPWQYMNRNMSVDPHQQDFNAKWYCRALTTCTAAYTFKTETETNSSTNSTTASMTSNSVHFTAPSNSHVMYNQCQWPTIGLNGTFVSAEEFTGDLVLTGHEQYTHKKFKARDDLGQDTTQKPLCQAMENAVKGTPGDPTTANGYLKCEKFWMRKCQLTEPQGHEWAVYMIKPGPKRANASDLEPRLHGRDAALNMMYNPAMWAATQNSRADQLVTVVWMPPTMLAIDTYLYGLHTLGGSFTIKLDPGLMSGGYQTKMNKNFVLQTLAGFSGTDITQIVNQYSAMTSFCGPELEGGYPRKMYLQSEFTCGVDPSAESVEAMGEEDKRLWGFKQRLKATNARRNLIYGHEYIMSDAGLGTLTGGTPESIEVRVLSENNHWRIPSDPHCWDGQP